MGGVVVGDKIQQIVRDRAVPLSLCAEQSLYAELLNARMAREQGVEDCSGEEVLAHIDRAIAGSADRAE